jgi:hypothetical protein
MCSRVHLGVRSTILAKLWGRRLGLQMEQAVHAVRYKTAPLRGNKGSYVLAENTCASKSNQYMHILDKEKLTFVKEYLKYV